MFKLNHIMIKNIIFIISGLVIGTGIKYSFDNYQTVHQLKAATASCSLYWNEPCTMMVLPLTMAQFINHRDDDKPKQKEIAL